MNSKPAEQSWIDMDLLFYPFQGNQIKPQVATVQIAPFTWSSISFITFKYKTVLVGYVWVCQSVGWEFKTNSV